MAATFKKRNSGLSAYRDQQFQGTLQEQEAKLLTSTTLYVGNLSFFTTEDQIYHLFSKSGDVKRVVMGLDRFTRTPCGFCFVEYYTRPDGEDAIRYVSGTRLDERVIRCDWDAGFVEGRQYGRGKSGGQVRDEFRTDYDAGRGGFGKLIQHRVDKFGPIGFDASPDRRFERGKRKRNDDDTGSQDGEEGDRTTDLRQKLQKMREDRGKNADENGDIIPADMEENTDPAIKESESERSGGETLPESESITLDESTIVDVPVSDRLDSLVAEKANGDVEMESSINGDNGEEIRDDAMMEESGADN